MQRKYFDGFPLPTTEEKQANTEKRRKRAEYVAKEICKIAHDNPGCTWGFLMDAIGCSLGELQDANELLVITTESINLKSKE